MVKISVGGDRGCCLLNGFEPPVDWGDSAATLDGPDPGERDEIEL